MKFSELKECDYFKYDGRVLQKRPLSEYPSYHTNANLIQGEPFVTDENMAFIQDDTEVEQVFPFKIATEWSMCAETEAFAASLEDAVSQVQEDEDLVDITEGNYIDGSFQVNEEFTEEINREYLEGFISEKMEIEDE